MGAFPFTDEEWEAVREAAQAVASASQAEAPDLRAARFADLQAVLTWLRGRHREHPALLETEADFTTMPSEAITLYRRAEQEAKARGLPALSIRLALARVLVQELREPAAAMDALMACRDELPTASEAVCETWGRLLAECDRQAREAADAG